jgi:hypothetical protein
MQARQSRAAAFADGTKRNIMAQIRAFLMFCTYFTLQPFPVACQTLSSYIACLANSFRSSSSIINYIHGIKTAHHLLDQPFPDLRTFMLRMQIRGVQKQLGNVPTQAAIITPHVLMQMFSLLDMNNSFHVAVWCVFTIAFFSFARMSNLLPRTRNSFDHTKQLTRSDIVLSADTLLLNFKWTKTLQDHSRILSIPLTSIPNSPLCPVLSYNKLLQLCDIPMHRSAFCYNRHSNLITLTSVQVVSFLRELTSEMKLPPGKYTGHSFRRSGTTWAFRSGVRSESIRSHGDWRSLAYLQYIQVTPDQKKRVSQQMANTITSSFCR